MKEEMNDYIKNYLKNHWVKEILHIELVVVICVLSVLFKEAAKEIASILGMWYFLDLLEKVSSYANDKILGTEEKGF